MIFMLFLYLISFVWISSSFIQYFLTPLHVTISIIFFKVFMLQSLTINLFLNDPPHSVLPHLRLLPCDLRPPSSHLYSPPLSFLHPKVLYFIRVYTHRSPVRHPNSVFIQAPLCHSLITLFLLFSLFWSHWNVNRCPDYV